MSDQRIGAAFRAVRIRRGWRQRDVAVRAGVSASLVSLLERGHIGSVSLTTLRAVATVLDIRVDVVARWRGGELDRLLSARHSALQEVLARLLVAADGWEFAPEVSFAFYSERGVIDLLAWHASTQTLLVIEVKTEIVDLPELLGTLDRKTRLAARIARDRGWRPRVVGTWLVVAEGTTNRRRIYATNDWCGRHCLLTLDRSNAGYGRLSAGSPRARSCHTTMGVALSESSGVASVCGSRRPEGPSAAQH